MRTPPTLIFCGTGRCGTAYAAELLSEIGVPCGHQRVFSPERPLAAALRVRRRPPWAESSPAALPALREIPESVLCVHLVRHPFQVLASIERRGFFARGGDDEYVRFAEAALPPLATVGDPLERAARFVIGWNAAIEDALRARAPALRSRRIQVEELGRAPGTVVIRLLAEVAIEVEPVRARAALARVPGDFNTDGRTESAQQAAARLARLPAEVASELVSLAHAYGYPTGRTARGSERYGF